MHRVGKDVGDVLILRQRLRRGAGVVERVCPGTVGCDRHAAIGADDRSPDVVGQQTANRSAFDALHGLGVAGIDVQIVGEDVTRGGIGACKRRVAGIDAFFDNRRASVHVGDSERRIVGDRRVVGAGDIDRQRGGRRAAVIIGFGVAEDVVDVHALRQGIGRRVVVVQRIGPGAVGIEQQRSVETGDGSADASGKFAAHRAVDDADDAMGIAEVEVGIVEQHVAGRRRDACDHVVAGVVARLDDMPDIGIGMRDRRIVGAVDDDRHRLGDDAAVMVVDLNRIGQRHVLALGEVVKIVVRRRERPGLRARRAIGRIGQCAQRQPAQLGGIRGKARGYAGCDYAGDRDIVRIGQIEIGEGDRTVGGIRRNRIVRAGGFREQGALCA